MLGDHTSPCLLHRLEKGFKACRSDAFEKKDFIVSTGQAILLSHKKCLMSFSAYGPPERKAHTLVQLRETIWGLKLKKEKIRSKVHRSYEENMPKYVE